MDRKRNFEAVLNAISKGSLEVNSLITDRIELLNYQKIYGDMANTKSIASILKYPTESEEISTIEIHKKSFEGKKRYRRNYWSWKFY